MTIPTDIPLAIPPRRAAQAIREARVLLADDPMNAVATACLHSLSHHPHPIVRNEAEDALQQASPGTRTIAKARADHRPQGDNFVELRP